MLAAVLCAAAMPLAARYRDSSGYGTGLVNDVPLPESEVAAVVREVAHNGIIRGTKEYNKDEYVAGAEAEASSSLFSAGSEGGEVFYKVRKHALDPRNFKDSNDIGTIAVRYIVQPRGDNSTVLRIDAVFVEDFRRTAHPSNGSVESSEYKIIRDHLDEIEAMKSQASQVERERQDRAGKKDVATGEITAPSIASDSPTRTQLSGTEMPPRALSSSTIDQRPETLEQHVATLRRELERRVKAPGAPLRSAPFHSANNLRTLPSGTEVLIVITTPYWFGVEARDGQHGWIPREQLELLP